MKFVLFANTDWYLYNFRLSTALELKARGHEVVMLSPPGEFGGRFAAHGLTWRTLGMNRASLNPLREAITLRGVVNALKEEKPDLLHSFTVKCAVYGALAARMAKVPAVVNAVAGMGIRIHQRQCQGQDTTADRQFPDALDAGKRKFASDPAESRRRGCLRPGRDGSVGPDPPHPQFRGRHLAVLSTRHARATRPLRVLLAARLLWEKGVGEFVEASRQVKRAGRDVEFFLAGTPDPGNPRSVTHAEAERWANDGSVNWLGHVDDMPGLLRSMDVMALPSYYREGRAQEPDRRGRDGLGAGDDRPSGLPRSRRRAWSRRLARGGAKRRVPWPSSF
jgi:glycosyltransferase involved in cell wall biosynthesis